MRNLNLLSFAMLMIVSISPNAQASDSVSGVSVQCPQEPTMSAVNGWVGAPRSGAFIKSYIGDSAGTKTLICRYVANQMGFSIKRAPPRETPVCHPTETGFSCKPKYYTSYVTRRGVVTIDPSAQSDLDLVALERALDKESGGKSDLWFDFITPSMSTLRPVNGAVMGVYEGDKIINKNECARTKLSTQPISMETLKSGVNLCLKSSAGRYSTLQIDEVPASQVNALALAFITWR